MRRVPILAGALCLALATTAILAPSAGRAQDQPIYGSQMMTEQERAAYRDRLRNAATEQEREQIRLEQHRMMQERARQQGLSLPDEAPAAGPTMGQQPPVGMGMGQGSGMGQGGMGQGGMGQGMRRGGR